MAKAYGNESISSQTAVETCRNNLPTFFGSIDLSGAQQSIKEILSNSIDEAKVGAGNEIKVTIGKDNSVKIEDFGRGLPVDWNKKENNWNWILTLQTLHSGGKFADNRDNFKNSTGLNGLGLAVTAMSSKWFKCESRRDGYIYHVELENGVPVEKNIDKVLKKEKDPKGNKQQTGTIISWKCDTDEVYLSDDFDLEFLKNWCKTQAILTDDVAIVLEDKRNNFKEIYKYKNGIETFAKEEVGENTKFTEIDIKGSGKDAPTRKAYEVTGRVLFTFTEKANSYWFHNSLPLTSGGSPKKAEETAFVNFFGKQLKNKDLTFEDIQENLFFISNTLTQIPPTFKNQTKEAIDMPFIEQFLVGQITKALTNWAKENPLDLDKINQQITVNIEARKSAKSQRQLTKEKLSGKIKLTDKIDKLTECRSKDNNINEVFIVEGDSAAGTLITARNSDFQAVYALRGKIKNVLKMNLSDILSFPILTNVIKVIGTGIEIPSGKKGTNKLGDFDINNRRFSKFIISTDSDSDGEGHITSLLLTLFYTLMPELLREGRVYQLMTPLFVFDIGNEKISAYTDKERDEIIKKYGNKIKKVSRYKGLGEWTAKDFRKFLNPQTRRLLRFTIKDAKKAKDQLELWMADDSEPRKKYLTEHGQEFKDLELS